MVKAKRRPIAVDTARPSPSPGLPYLRTGLCGNCMLPLEAQQPGGLNPRHAASLIPYGECPEAKRILPPITRSGDLCEMKPVDTELIAKLDHYNIDPRDIRHWRHVRDTTGGSHRVFDPKFPGEE